MRAWSVAALLLFFPALSGCTRPDAPAADGAAVRMASDQYRTALNTADTTSFLALLAEDLELFPPGAAAIKGSPAHDVFRGLFREFVVTLDPLIEEEWLISGDLAVQRYAFRLNLRPKAAGKPTTESGAGIHVWRRGSDGRWRLAKDIWTTTRAPLEAR